MGLQFLSLLPQPGQPGAAGGAAGAAGGAAGGSMHPNAIVRSVDDSLTNSGLRRLTYAEAMHQIHTGEIPGLHTFTVEEGMRIEEAQRALEEAANMQAMSERAEARRAKKELAEIDERCGDEDLEERAKLIKRDEYRDMVKKGSGNRKNRN